MLENKVNSLEGVVEGFRGGKKKKQPSFSDAQSMQTSGK